MTPRPVERGGLVRNHSLHTAGWTVLAVLVVLTLAVLGGVYLGAYNVAASEPHTGLVRRTLDVLQQRSVAARAGSVGEPVTPDSVALREAYLHYREMCAVCHGAPGEERGEIGKGMNPTPPKLERVADHWTDREIFWILNHGIKLAGMPAFGATHEERELWALVAVVRSLPALTPEEFRRRAGPDDTAGDASAPGGHAHPEGEEH